MDEFFGDPQISDKAFVCQGASVIGEVYIEKDVLIAPGASIRADECGPFKIGIGTNVQDGVILHGLLNKYLELEGKSYSIWIGSHCSIAHRALIHGPTMLDKKTFVGFDAIIHASVIGRNCFIDFKAVVKNARVGKNCHIGIGATVTDVIVADGKYVADGQIVNMQHLADILPLTPPEKRDRDNDFNKEVVDLNKELIRLYRARARKS